MAEFSQPAPPEDEKGNAAEAIRKIQDLQDIFNHAEYYKKKYLGDKKGREDAEAAYDDLREIVIRRASDITPKRVRWLWAPGDEQYGRIPIGELTLIVGRGGIGKSTLLAEFAAWITKGEMRGEYFGKPRDVLYVANEDSLEYTVVPRMMAAGADLDRIHFIGINMLGREDKVILPSDCDGLADYALKHDAAAIMLDPLSSNLRAKSNAGDEVRPVMEAVRKMAERASVACIALAHTRKATSTNLMDAIMGSSELGNVCRSAMGVMRDEDADDGSVVLSQEKNNLGRVDIDSYRYRVESATIWSGQELIETSRLAWLGRTPMRVSEMLHDSVAGGLAVKGAVAEAAAFIRDYLTDKGGQELKADVQRAAMAEGYSRSTIERAARKLNLDSRPSGQGAKRIWVLPPQS